MFKPARNGLAGFVAAVAMLAGTGGALGQSAASDFESAIRNQAAINEELLKLSEDERVYFQHVTTLSNPFFEGRAPGLRGNELAAEYVEFNFRKLGLVPAFTDGDEPTMRQPFSAGSETRIVKQDVGLTLDGQNKKLVPGVDFNLLSTGGAASGTGKASGPLVFVGYGVQGGPNDYNTVPAEAEPKTPKDGEAPAKGFLEGKIAMVLRFEPMNEQGRSKWVDDAGAGEWSNRANYMAKVQTLAKYKPAAIVVVNPPGADDARASRLDEMRNMRGLARTGIPVVMMSAEKAEAIAKASGTTMMELRRQADAQGTVVEMPRVTVAIDSETKREPITTQNVAAVLVGKGALADQYIVVGAHLDHVGYGGNGSRGGARAQGKLHPGADDNASGTSGLLLSAAKLSEMYGKLPAGAQARSILFVAFSAEELGLIGSRHFVQHSPIPESKTYAMLNMDMIGRVRKNGVEVSGVGSAENFLDLLRPVFDRSGMKVSTLPGGQGPSDHAMFYAANIPVLHFFTGLHPQYHLPEDFYFTINPVGAVKVVNLLDDVAMMLATRSEALPFTKARGPSINMNDPNLLPEQAGEKRGESRPLATDQALAQAREEARKARENAMKEQGGGAGEKASPHGEGMAAPASGSGRTKVRFGIGPSQYGDDTPGVLVGEVYPGTPAAEAGIKANDRLIKWNGKEITSVESWSAMLYSQKPGDVVKIVLVREGKEVTVDCKLKARDEEAK